jgi:hypothetical protein
MRHQIVFTVLAAMLGSAAFAAEDTSRTYANPSCSDRNANPDNCVIQNGPPRRTAFPPPEQKPPATKPPSQGNPGVSILGGGDGTPRGSQGGR